MRFPFMISPASGIRRPSYNGAPAMQGTLGFQKSKAITSALFCCPLSFVFFPSISLKSLTTRRFNVRGRACLRRSKTLKSILNFEF